MDMNKVFAVIPAHNERENIFEVVKKTKRIVKNVIVVDDGSRDITVKRAKEAEAVVLTHVVNLGKGAALKTGCDYAVSKGAEILVAIDADGQHDPEDIPNFLKEFLGGYDIVFGYRKFDRNMPFVLRLGNRAISICANLLYRVRVYDTQCGYRAFRKEVYRKIRWRSNDYSMETEMIAKVGRYHIKYSQVPIKTRYPDRYKGTTILDGIKIVVDMMFWWFRFIIL